MVVPCAVDGTSGQKCAFELPTKFAGTKLIVHLFMSLDLFSDLLALILLFVNVVAVVKLFPIVVVLGTMWCRRERVEVGLEVNAWFQLLSNVDELVGRVTHAFADLLLCLLMVGDGSGVPWHLDALRGDITIMVKSNEPDKA